MLGDRTCDCPKKLLTVGQLAKYSEHNPTRTLILDRQRLAEQPAKPTAAHQQIYEAPLADLAGQVRHTDPLANDLKFSRIDCAEYAFNTRSRCRSGTGKAETRGRPHHFSSEGPEHDEAAG